MGVWIRACDTPGTAGHHPVPIPGQITELVFEHNVATILFEVLFAFQPITVKPFTEWMDAVPIYLVVYVRMSCVVPIFLTRFVRYPNSVATTSAVEC